MERTDFIEHLTGTGRSAKTIAVYARLLDRIQAAIGPIEDATAVMIREFSETLPRSYSSLRQLSCTITAAFEMLDAKNPARAVVIPRRPRPRCVALDESDAAVLVKAARGWYPEGLAVLFGMFLALRAHEIAEARLSRFDENYQWYTVLGKGGVVADLPVNAELAREVRQAPIAGDRLFPGHRGRTHVHPSTVLEWTRRVADEAGIVEKVWTHRLRHTALATANDALQDLRAVSEFARHSRLDETLRYTRTTEKHLRAVADSLVYA